MFQIATLRNELLGSQRNAVIIAERDAPHAHLPQVIDGERREAIGDRTLQVVAATELPAAAATRHCERKT
jgi:hypothetical protein